MATTNKENLPETPKRAVNSTVEHSPRSLKKALKPISPNKNNTTVGKLNFLQNDNFDEHFDHIHDVQEQLQQQLHNIELQTKQTGEDVGQLVDRLKNNNSNLNKLLEQIASYSDEVITEGNATKHDITNIIAILDGVNEKLDKNTNSQQIINEITEKLTNVIISQDNDKQTQLVATKLEIQSDIINTLNSKLEKFTKEPVSDEILAELQHIKASVAKAGTKNNTDEFKDIVISENSNLSKLFLGKAVEDQSIAAKETEKLLGLISDHQSRIEAKFIEQVDIILKQLQSTKTHNSSQDLAVREILANISTNNESKDAKLNENHAKIIASIQALQNSIPSDSIVSQIVDPIVKQLNSKSDTLLENILATLTKQETRQLSDSNNNETKSILQTISNNSQNSVESNREFQSNLNTKLDSISANIIELKDKRILDLEAQLNQNHILLETSLECTELSNKKLDLEKKINILQGKYSQMQLEYQSRYDDLKKLISQYDEFIKRANSPNVVVDEGINLQKVRQLHLHKMQDLQNNRMQKTRSKRILSSPVIHNNISPTKQYFKESLPIIDSD